MASFSLAQRPEMEGLEAGLRQRAEHLLQLADAERVPGVITPAQPGVAKVCNFQWIQWEVDRKPIDGIVRPGGPPGPPE
jgi:hypothetical protein